MRYTTIGSGAGSRRVSKLALGVMKFGTDTDVSTSYDILDRFVEAGGTFVDTSNNYAYWANGTQGGESETVLGQWRRDRGIGDELVISTKVGARPTDVVERVENGWENQRTRVWEGLAPENVHEQADRSRERLGVDRLDLYYAHVPDMNGVPLEEYAAGFAALVKDGVIGQFGLSNHWSWQVERARAVNPEAARPSVLQFHHTYLRMRTDIPDRRLSVDGEIGVADASLLALVRATPGLTLVAYTPLLSGAYTNPAKPLDPAYDHPGTTARLAVLDEVAAETGATRNQVVLAWMLGDALPVIPLVGASSVAQLDESLAAVDLELSEEQRRRLDAAGR
ncbi:aldo/keto reductase [Nocardioides sp. NPDC051685]|uniref:aldo/keto reductase n=1 Tax=Nocardioides sp. NPDC051685 TaxID=3364334 RepID=UPI0037BA5365